MMISENNVLEHLKTVLDPELGINIVDLGLVYGTQITNNNLKVDLTLTTPGCPLINEFIQNAKEALAQIEGVGSITINITFDPPWSPQRMSPEAAEELGLLL
jgi:metal-sulfur cluster biosynthetic enzyme